MFQNLEGAMRRSIRKAESSGLQIEFGEDDEAIRTYYGLHCLTRARHGVPPQPFRFFENIARHVVGKKQGFTVTARLGRQPVASAVFFHHHKEAIYKFGASDFAYQQLRANNLIMWTAIKRLASEAFTSLHMGRTSVANEGLRRFKLAFGAREEKIEYFKYDLRSEAFVPDVDRAETWVNQVLRRMPRSGLRLVGKLLYPLLS
jgi:lipid II:glycine glycyltransferase (peptidoglycan interpeptide bridge formation enzyme)